MKSRTIIIMTLVDVVGALADGSLKNNIYLMDNNKEYGSSEEGTDILNTKVSKGDTVIWNVTPFEPEAYTEITDIIISDDICRPVKRRYEGSDITYWIGKVSGDVTDKFFYYNMKFKVGSSENELITENSPCLVLQGK